MHPELMPLFGVSRHGSGASVGLEPVGVVVNSRSTVPCGGLFMPESVSVTVTVQVAGVLAGVEAGQSTTVEVVRAVTLIVSVPELAACTEAGAGPELPVIVS